MLNTKTVLSYTYIHCLTQKTQTNYFTDILEIYNFYVSHNYLFCLFKNYPVKLLFPTKKGKDVSWEFRYFKEFKYRNLFTVFSQPFVKYWLSINQTHSSVVWAFSVQNIESVGSWPRYPQDRNKLPLPLFYVSLFLWFIWRSSIELGLLVSPGVP